MNKWWVISVPYAFVFGSVLAILPEYTWTLGHVLTPLFIYYWLAYYSSTAWTIVYGSMTIFHREISFANALRLILGLVTIVVPLLFSHGWPGF